MTEMDGLCSSEKFVDNINILHKLYPNNSILYRIWPVLLLSIQWVCMQLIHAKVFNSLRLHVRDIYSTLKMLPSFELMSEIHYKFVFSCIHNGGTCPLLLTSLERVFTNVA